MTDRIRTLTVALDADYRDDDVEQIINAIHMVKGVSAVKPGVPVDPTDWAARWAVRKELRDVLWTVFQGCLLGDDRWKRIKQAIEDASA